MFVSPQLSTGSPAAITTIIGGEVAVVSFAAACCFCDLSMVACALPCCRGPLAGRFQAVWSCKAATTAAAAAQQRGSYHGAARAGRSRVSGGSGRAVPPAICARSAARGCRKKCAHEWSFFGLSCVPERAQACHSNARSAR